MDGIHFEMNGDHFQVNGGHSSDKSLYHCLTLEIHFQLCFVLFRLYFILWELNSAQLCFVLFRLYFMIQERKSRHSALTSQPSSNVRVFIRISHITFFNKCTKTFFWCLSYVRKNSCLLKNCAQKLKVCEKSY